MSRLVKLPTKITNAAMQKKNGAKIINQNRPQIENVISKGDIFPGQTRVEKTDSISRYKSENNFCGKEKRGGRT